MVRVLWKVKRWEVDEAKKAKTALRRMRRRKKEHYGMGRAEQRKRSNRGVETKSVTIPTDHDWADGDSDGNGDGPLDRARTLEGARREVRRFTIAAKVD